MGLIPLYDANGNVLLDSGGNIIYLSYEGPTDSRTIEVPEEANYAEVSEE